MENEHELSYETLTRVYLGSYEYYKGVGAEVEHSKPGFDLQGAKMVETGQNLDFRLRTARVTTPGLRRVLEREVDGMQKNNTQRSYLYPFSRVSPSDHPKDRSSLDASAKLTQAKLNKRSGDANLSNDKSGLESPPELRRSWCVEGYIKFGVISSVLMQRYLRTIRQRYSPCEGPLSFE
ncbi:hypothetical protein Tco_0122836 [Tanacetum coccineum]